MRCDRRQRISVGLATAWLIAMWPAVVFSLFPRASAAEEPPAPPNPAAPSAPLPATSDAAAEIEFFEKEVRPVLATRCQSCHGAEKQKGGLRLDSPEGLRRGGDSGPVLVVADPDTSPLIQAVGYSAETRMPPDGKLPDAAIQAIRQWVRIGAPWPPGDAGPPKAPEKSPPTSSPMSPPTARDDPWRRHWALQPVVERAPPLVASSPVGWTSSPIDRFVLSTLEKKGLSPSPPADRRTLIRRATFDLVGLPPRPDEVEAFVADADPDAFARLVDRLLASPHYGERWGRHWLDVARYGDSKGETFSHDVRYPYAYTYRDWVVRSLNDDMPYDEFVIQQIAADCAGSEVDKRDLPALGFLTLGRRVKENLPDVIDDRIDVVTRGLLGLTVACARCHDHKFDPIPTADYYSLYGVFASTDERLVELEAPSEEYTRELAKRQQDITRYLAGERSKYLSRVQARLGDYLLAAREAQRGGSAGSIRVGEGENELQQPMLDRWREFLERIAAAKFDPVFGPWLVLGALPEENFADAAALLIADFAQQTSGETRVNPLLSGELAAHPPAALKDVAQIYAALLGRADDAWRKALAAADGDHQPPPTALPDPGLEELRQSVQGPARPLDLSLDDYRKLLDQAQRQKLTALEGEITNLRASDLGPASAMAMVDRPSPVTQRVFVRGNPDTPGEETPRRFLACLAGENRRPFEHGSGRAELARAIANRQNPLTARVFVNRVWQERFGAGLVATASDFGVRTEPPTHPELLDYLAWRFMESGWSIKSLHRLMMLTGVYTQASHDRPDCKRVDPSNRLLWKMNRRRLDWEATRDSLLAVSGKLDPAIGGRPVDLLAEPFTARRTVYGLIDRKNLPGVFRAFDLASPDTHSPRRFVTTTPQQSLFLFNSPFVVEKACEFAARPELASAAGDEERIRRMYALAFNRPPSEEEISLGREFLSACAADEAAAANRKLDAWQLYAQGLLLTNEFFFVD